MKMEDVKPFFDSVEKTDRQLATQGYSFNETGQSFNEVGVIFGGLYGNEGAAPK